MSKDAEQNDRKSYMTSLEKKMNQYKEKFDDYSKSSQKTTEAVKEKYQKAQDIYDNLKTAAEDQWEDVKAQSSKVFSELEKSLHQALGNDTWEQMTHVKEEVIDYGQEKMERLGECIKKKPCTSALWALAIGFMVGKMWGSSR